MEAVQSTSCNGVHGQQLSMKSDAGVDEAADEENVISATLSFAGRRAGVLVKRMSLEK